ncbi:MAG TPA: hypothetical protein VMV69_05340 [Pirellulales bacterium]|nr:hypothetical protein [Pirellulales bacterium]
MLVDRSDAIDTEDPQLVDVIKLDDGWHRIWAHRDPTHSSGWRVKIAKELVLGPDDKPIPETCST